jgi:glycosyltransferase involved in cell wall biosynthesis
VKIAVATPDTLTARMAGPAIRAWQIANALAGDGHEVQLVTTTLADLPETAFPVRAVDDEGLAEVERWCDVLVFQGWLVHKRPFLLGSDKVLVADVYDPLHLEQLEQGRDDGWRGRIAAVQSATAVLNEQLLRGDFFLCASEKQRDFWLGQLSALGRVNPVTYDADETLRSLITVVPFGVPEAPPVCTRPAIKGVVPGIGPDDQVLLWGGGIYNWFDPLTLLRAVDRLRGHHPGVRLFFLGLKHPNPDIPEMRMAVAARELSDRLGLTGTHAFFNEGWVDYDDRHNYLLDADVGVSTHLDHVETAFSFRTRVLDYFWASLPTVATAGDAMGDLIESRQLGLTVPAGDVDALVVAVARLLDDGELRAAMAVGAGAMAAELTWPKVLAPLVDFCREPRRAPDLLEPAVTESLRHDLAEVKERWRGLAYDLRTAADHLRQGGPALAARKAAGRVRRVAVTWRDRGPA